MTYKVKKLIRKLPLFILFFSVVGYALYEYRKSLNEEEADGDRLPLFSGNFNEAEEIQISNDKFSLLIKKDKGDWFLKKPIEDFADFEDLSRWFEALQSEKLQLISEGSDIRWNEYHLTDPSMVEIRFSSGKNITFSVSRKPSFDGNWFVKKDGKLLLAKSSLGTQVNTKTLDSYRSKKLLHSFGHPTKVKFQEQGSRSLEFTWEKSKWTYVGGGKDFPLDLSYMNTFWTDLNSLKGIRISGPKSKANIKKFGLLKPFVIVSLDFGKDRKTRLIRFSQVKEDKVQALVSTRNYILEIPKEDFENILLSKDNIRDHSQPFRYDKEAASWIKLQGYSFSYTAKKQPSDSTKEKGKADFVWNLIEPKDKKIDSHKTSSLLNTIYNLEGKKYKKGSIGKIKASLEIKNQNNAPVFKMQAGDSYMEDKDEFVWVQTSLSADKVAVLKESLDFVFKENPLTEEREKESSVDETKTESSDTSTEEKIKNESSNSSNEKTKKVSLNSSAKKKESSSR